jgi:nitrate reductase gamma subunit
MPWMMQSTRQHPLFYAQFVIFHIGVACSIAMSIVFSYLPGMISAAPVVLALQIIFATAFVVGVLRFIRRLTVPVIRMISSPDDIFSVALLTVWLALSFIMAGQAPAFAVAKGQLESSAVALNEMPIVVYYLVTSFFLVYVPFSKISHYIYYPFSRWYLGRTMGHRGVYPIRRYQS